MMDLSQRRQQALVWLEGGDAAGLTSPVRANLRHWLEHPSHTEYWPALVELVERRNLPELTRLFWEVIPFGTGGRRGPMAELGSATINRRTIAESAWGMARYLVETHPTSASPCSVLVGYDSRHRSREFAELTASVFLAQGCHVCLFDAPCATPQLSFAIRHRQAQGGVMISASHNPPADNGFKAYWSHGGQVLPPHDRGIMRLVDQADDVPLMDLDESRQLGSLTMAGHEIDSAYVAAVTSLAHAGSRDVRILFTPLHGVGERSVVAVLRAAGFDVEVFALQQNLDGDFTHVPDQLPNPERAAVFDPAIQDAREQGFDIVLASDPDADRLAVAVQLTDGSFEVLSGNQLGALLADWALSRGESRSGYVLQTLVTTPQIAAIARSYGHDVKQDLPVGFKYIGGEMEQHPGQTLLLAAEESLGYLAGDYARDKDAAIAALWTAELAAETKSRGQTLVDRWKELQSRYGWHRERQRSWTCRGPAGVQQIAELISRWRQEPPTALAAFQVVQMRDYGRQEVRSVPDGHLIEPLATNAGELIFLDLVCGQTRAQVALRPSGTEPKLKCYLFVILPVEDQTEGESKSLRFLDELEAAIEQWLGLES